MNICVSGPDACGKTTLANKMIKQFGVDVIHSTATTSNTKEYHTNLLDYHDNTYFDRFVVGEMIFPKIYGREPKLTEKEFYEVLQRVIDNNDMYIMFVCSDIDILKNRLVERGELDYLKEIEQQCELYNEVADSMRSFFGSYKYFYVIDIAEEDAYDKLDRWIDDNFGKVSINKAYRQLAKDLFEKGESISSQNIRGADKEICNYSFTISDLSSNYITLKTANTNLTYLAAELLWYWSNRNDTRFIGKFASLWEKLSDDGITNNSAYGYILKSKHGFNQIDKIIELLKKDPTSRRAVMNINVPNANVIETKDEPCTICLVYQIRHNKLNCTCIMRSNDMNFGTRNDLGFFIFLQKYIAKALNVDVGTYTHFSTSIHYYLRDEKMVKRVAYGDMEQQEDVLDIDALVDNSVELCDMIDSDKINNKSELEEELRNRNIIK